MSKDKYEVEGEMDFDEADYANIPVNIFLSKHTDDTGKETGKWELTGEIFMPRKQSVYEGAFKFVSDDRQVLVDMVQKHWRPLYEKALEKLKLEPGKDDEDGEASLYYWS